MPMYATATKPLAATATCVSASPALLVDLEMTPGSSVAMSGGGGVMSGISLLLRPSPPQPATKTSSKVARMVSLRRRATGHRRRRGRIDEPLRYWQMPPLLGMVTPMIGLHVLPLGQVWLASHSCVQTGFICPVQIMLAAQSRSPFAMHDAPTAPPPAIRHWKKPVIPSTSGRSDAQVLDPQSVPKTVQGAMQMP